MVVHGGAAAALLGFGGGGPSSGGPGSTDSTGAHASGASGLVGGPARPLVTRVLRGRASLDALLMFGALLAAAHAQHDARVFEMFMRLVTRTSTTGDADYLGPDFNSLLLPSPGRRRSHDSFATPGSTAVAAAAAVAAANIILASSGEVALSGMAGGASVGSAGPNSLLRMPTGSGSIRDVLTKLHLQQHSPGAAAYAAERVARTSGSGSCWSAHTGLASLFDAHLTAALRNNSAAAAETATRVGVGSSGRPSSTEAVRVTGAVAGSVSGQLGGPLGGGEGAGGSSRMLPAVQEAAGMDGTPGAAGEGDAYGSQQPGMPHLHPQHQHHHHLGAAGIRSGGGGAAGVRFRRASGANPLGAGALRSDGAAFAHAPGAGAGALPSGGGGAGRGYNPYISAAFAAAAASGAHGGAIQRTLSASVDFSHYSWDDVYGGLLGTREDLG
eukprot:XP_001695532.1 predicted protein [Chlamydomonas reinhardtii]